MFILFEGICSINWTAYRIKRTEKSIDFSVLFILSNYNYAWESPSLGFWTS